ncbi:MAG: hypothetical protein ACI30A_06535 [Paludibacteraceae bacterium]
MTAEQLKDIVKKWGEEGENNNVFMLCMDNEEDTFLISRIKNKNAFIAMLISIIVGDPKIGDAIRTALKLSENKEMQALVEVERVE